MGVDTKFSCYEEAVPALSLGSFPPYVITFFGQAFLNKILDICERTQAASDLSLEGITVDSLPIFLAFWREDTGNGLAKTLYFDFQICIKEAHERAKRQARPDDLKATNRAMMRFAKSMRGALIELESILVRNNQVAAVIYADLIHLDWYDVQLRVLQAMDSSIEETYNSRFLSTDERKAVFRQSIKAHFDAYGVPESEQLALSQMCSLWLCLPQIDYQHTDSKDDQHRALKTENNSLFPKITQQVVDPGQSLTIFLDAEPDDPEYSYFLSSIRIDFLDIPQLFNRIQCTVTLLSGEEIQLSLSLLNGQLSLYNYGVYASLSPIFKAKNAGLIYEQWRNIILKCISDKIADGELKILQKKERIGRSIEVPQELDINDTDIQETIEATQAAVDESFIGIDDDEDEEEVAPQVIRTPKKSVNLNGISRDDALAVLFRLGFTAEQGKRHMILRHGTYAIAFPNQHKGNERPVLKTLLAIFRKSPINRTTFITEWKK